MQGDLFKDANTKYTPTQTSTYKSREDNTKWRKLSHLLTPNDHHHSYLHWHQTDTLSHQQKQTEACFDHQGQSEPAVIVCLQ